MRHTSRKEGSLNLAHRLDEFCWHTVSYKAAYGLNRLQSSVDCYWNHVGQYTVVSQLPKLPIVEKWQLLPPTAVVHIATPVIAASITR